MSVRRTTRVTRTRAPRVQPLERPLRGGVDPLNVQLQREIARRRGVPVAPRAPHYTAPGHQTRDRARLMAMRRQADSTYRARASYRAPTYAPYAYGHPGHHHHPRYAYTFAPRPLLFRPRLYNDYYGLPRVVLRSHSRRHHRRHTKRSRSRSRSRRSRR